MKTQFTILGGQVHVLSMPMFKLLEVQAWLLATAIEEKDRLKRREMIGFIVKKTFKAKSG